MAAVPAGRVSPRPLPAGVSTPPATRPAGPIGVVVGVDGAAGCRAAVDQAAARAGRSGCGLRMLHVLDPLADPPRLDEDAATALLAALAARVRLRRPPVPVSTELATGAAAATLVDRAAGAELLVLGSRDSGAAPRWLARSVTAQVATFAPLPVMVVRPVLADPAGGPVLVGVDGSAAGDAAVRFALREARARRVPLLALHVAERPPVPAGGRLWGGGDSGGLVAPLRGGLLAADQPPSGPVVERRRIEGDPVAALVAGSRGAGLVVVGAHRPRGFASARLGSVSQALIRHAHCPVVVVHPAPVCRAAA